MARLKRLPEDVDFNKVALLYGETDDGMYVAIDVDDEGRIRISGIGISDISKTKTVILTGNQATAILSPSDGKRLRILGARIVQPGTGWATLRFVGSNIVVYSSVTPAQAAYQPCRIGGLVNEPLTASITGAGGADQIFFMVNYEEF